MISMQDKEAILNGAYGITREGKKVKYIGKRDTSDGDLDFPLFFVVFNQKDEISRTLLLSRDFTNFKWPGGDNDVVGLWEDKPEPFDLERALAGEPVKLRNGKKAYMKYIMPPEYKGSYPIRGYIIDPSSANEIESNSWTLDGMGCVPTGVHSLDISSMWKDPEPESNTVAVTLPRALKEPKDGMWYVNECGVHSSLNDEDMAINLFNNRVYFGSKEDAKAWFDAMQDSRKWINHNK